MARRKKTTRRKNGLPHPSITALAGGLIIANRINQGADKETTITGALAEGNFDSAVKRFMAYTPALVTTSGGQTALIQGIGVATVGAFIRKSLPMVKLGGSKIYARI